MNKHVLVVGAGVIGAASALALVEKGFRVSLIDKADKLGQGASGDNGAQLSYCNTDALATPDTLLSMPKLLLGMDPSFRLRLRFDPDFIKWIVDFINNCTWLKSDRNTIAILETSLKSQAILENWRIKYSFEFNHRVSQKLHLYDNHGTLEKARRRVELKNRFGANQLILTQAEAIQIEPSLEKMNSKLLGAVHSPSEEVGDVKKFTEAAIKKSIEIGGGELFLDTEFVSAKTANNHCGTVITSQGHIVTDYIIICAGYQSAILAKRLGIRIPPICPVAGYSLTFPVSEYTPNVSLTDTTNKIVLCRLGSKLRVAGMADVGQILKSPPGARIKSLNNILQKRFPKAGNYSDTSMAWSGMRPMTANGRPIISKTKLQNVFINSGHGMLGWTLAAGAADTLAQLLPEP